MSSARAARGAIDDFLREKWTPVSVKHDLRLLLKCSRGGGTGRGLRARARRAPSPPPRFSEALDCFFRDRERRRFNFSPGRCLRARAHGGPFSRKQRCFDSRKVALVAACDAHRPSSTADGLCRRVAVHLWCRSQRRLFHKSKVDAEIAMDPGRQKRSNLNLQECESFTVRIGRTR
ncbi:hypothetical protein EVAR_23707_1 [Eumeta japonica]|uniref:Uncharacterized protein n=1 Tax=Eumeta variegata TaxID=151549 RepID=A0A4C1VGD0_EUMVA|nr:hypothetical protein EVAR_23707_1 [Eumeta japonica]